MKKTPLFSIICFCFMLFVSSSTTYAQDGSLLRVNLTTGSDDLRGGNTAYLKVNRMNGTSSDEMVIGGGFGQNSHVEKDIDLPGVINLSEIRSITIRHNGSPNGPFDSYDNWDLQTISIALISNDGETLNVYNSANDRNRSRFVQRFTGDRRQVILFRQRTAQ